MASPFSNPFESNPQGQEGIFGADRAIPRASVLQGIETQEGNPLDTFRGLETQVETRSIDDVLDPLGSLPETAPRFNYDSQLLSEPMDSRGPTAFQQKKINWADGGADPNRPVPFQPGPIDFLEVDYQFGKKSGASTDPVLAANVFGRQFTSQELQNDEEGRKLLDLMTARRSGEYNKGGSLANFGKGWSNWSKSDIPFYGWVSDIGTSVSEAIDMSKTMRKLQNGEQVTPHEALAVRRFMLQQELEGQRTMAYNVGAVVRQAVPFMAEMAATSAVGASIGAAVGLAPGAAIGGAAGAVIGGLRWLFSGGKVAAKAGTKMIVSQATKELAKRAVKGEAMSMAERMALRRSTSELLGKGALKGFREEAAKELGEGASRQAVRDLAAKRMYGQLAEAKSVNLFDGVAKQMLVEADVSNSVNFGAVEALKQWAAKKAPSYVVGRKMTERELGIKAKEGIAAMLKSGKDAYWKELEGFINGFSKQMVKDAAGKEIGVASEMIGSSMERVLASKIESRYAETITKSILTDAVKNFELRFGQSGMFSKPERFIRYAWDNMARGLLQSESALVRGGAPTLAHSGFGTFHGAWDALCEGAARSVIQAPIQAGIQLGVQAPVYLGIAAAHGGDVTFKGELGTQVQALMTGDRDKMDNAKYIALGQMFSEYWSENAGRGLAPMLGGAVAGVVRKSPKALLDSVNAGRDALLSPLSRATGSTLSKAVESVFGLGDVRKMSLQRVGEIATDYVNAVGIKTASKADIAKIVETKTLDGISDAFRRDLEKKGIKTAGDFTKTAINNIKDMTSARAARAYLGYYLMQKGFTPDRVVQAFRQMGKGGGIIEEMGEERFGDFIKGLFHFDDSASNASLLSDERLKNMFGGWVDGEQLATEFLGFAMPGMVRGGTLRLQSWMGKGAVSESRRAAETAARITTAASTAGTPTAAVEGVDEESKAAADKWVADVEASRERALGTTESNRQAVASRAAELVRDVTPSEDGTAVRRGDLDTIEQKIDAAGGKSDDQAVSAAIADLRTSQSAEDAADKLNRIATDVVESSANEQELESNLKLFGGEMMFGADGVQAIRREWRKVEGHTFDAAHPIEASLQEYRDLVKAGPERVTMSKGAPGTADDWAAKLVTYVPFAGKNTSAVADETARAAGKNGGIQAVSEAARTDLVDAMDTLAVNYGRSQSALDGRVGFMRRALNAVVSIPSVLATGDLSLAAFNPTGWTMADCQVPLRLQGLAYNAYFEGIKHGFRAIEGELDEEVRTKIDECVRSGSNLAVALSDLNVDRQTLQKMEEAGAEYRRELLDRASQEYLSACGVMTITQGDLQEPALRIVENKHKGEKLTREEITSRYSDEIELAKGEIVRGVYRIISDENVAHYSNYTDTGRNTFTFSVDARRAVENGTREEVLAAVLQLPAFRGVHGIINLSNNAEHTMETFASNAMARTVDATRIASMNAGARGKDLTVEQLGEVMQAMGRAHNNYSEAENRAAAAAWISQLRLMQEGSLTTYAHDDGRVGRVSPVSVNGTRSYVARITNSDGSVTTQSFPTWDLANSFMTETSGLRADHKDVIVTSVREMVSTDATSMMYFMYGSNQQAIREAYLREIGGDKAVTDDRRGLKPITVDENQLPPFVRKTWDIVDGVVKGSRFTYDVNGNGAEQAAAQFKTERLENPDRFEAYERVGETALAALGVVRTSTRGTRTAGMSADTFVARTDAGFNENALILAPDFASNGDSEAMLRSTLRLAFNTSIQSRDPECSFRKELLAYAYDEFMKAKDRVLDALQKTDKAKYEQLKEKMDRMFPRLTGRVGTDQLAAIAAASVFFTSDRGVLGLGNGYFGAPELAVVADEFRSSKVFPVFLSAVDEMLGGNGLFTKEASSVGGLARYLEAFAADTSSLEKARRSPLFTADANSRSKRNPYIVTYSYAGGMLRANQKREDGSYLTVDRFDGDVLREYIVPVANNCHEIARLLGAEDGRDAYTSAQMFNRMKSAGLFAGVTADAPAAEVQVSGGDITTTEAGATVAEKASQTQEATTITPEIAGRIAVSLRTVFRAAGLDYLSARAAAESYMRNRGIPEENVQQILARYLETGVTTDEIDVGAIRQENDAEDAKEAVENGESTSTEVFDHERNLEAFMNSKDAKTVSEVIKWFFKMEGGDVTALFDRMRRTFAAGSLVGATEADATLIAQFAEDMNPYADPSVTTAELAKTEFSTRFKSDSKALDSYLDSVTGALVKAGALDYALAIATIRRLPHARRLKLLGMMSQLTPTTSVSMSRRSVTDREFSMTADDAWRDQGRAAEAFQSMYTSLLSNRLLRGGKLAERLAGVETLVRGLRNFDQHKGTWDDLAKAMNVKGIDGKWVADLVSELAAVQKLSAKNPVMNGAYVSVDVTQADFDILTNALKNPTPDIVLVRRTVDNVMKGIVAKMDALVKVTDRIFGAGSDASAILRSRDALASVRADVERALLSSRKGENAMTAESRKAVLGKLWDLANLTAVLPVASIGRNGGGQRQFRPVSNFVWQLLMEPAVGLRLRGATADADTARRVLREMVEVKMQTDVSLDNGTTIEEMDPHYDASKLHGVSGLPYLISAYMTGMPRRNRTVGGRAKNAIEAKKARTVTTLPSQIPAFLRSTNSDLFKTVKTENGTALDILKANGLRWADGSNPIVAVTGATDLGNVPIEKRLLSGIAQRGIIDQFVRFGEYKNLVLPLFRGDKSSLYGIQVPVAVAAEWVKQVAADVEKNLGVKDAKPIVRLPKDVQSVLLAFMKRLGNKDLVQLAASAGDSKVSLDEVYAAGPEKFDGFDPVRKEMSLRADFYDLTYALLSAVCGQGAIDPKRVAVQLSVGSFIPMYSGEDANAGYYRTTIVGGTSGAAMMGGWFIHGCTSDAVSAMSDRGEKTQAKKLHVYGLVDGVDFDKGQSHDYGLGLDGDERTSLANISWWRKQMRQQVVNAMVAAGIQIDKTVGLEKPVLTDSTDPAVYDAQLKAYEANVAAYHEFKKTSTFGLDDLETHKAGAFGSKAGIAVPENGNLSILGVELLRDGNPAPTLPAWFRVKPEIKAGLPLAWAFSAVAASLGKDLSEADVMNAECKWIRPDGSDFTGTLKDSGLLPQDAKLSFRLVQDENADSPSCVAMDFFSKQMVAQIVANNSTDAAAKDGHSFAVNLTRDVEVDELLIRAFRSVSGESTAPAGFVDVHTGYVMLAIAQLQNDSTRGAFRRMIERDEELMEAIRLHPDDRDVRDRVFDKAKAFVAKQMIPNYHGTHGVMVASGLKLGPVDGKDDTRFNHQGTVEAAPGMDAYSIDCFRPAFVYDTKTKQAIADVTGYYGMDRSYASGCVNVRQRGFRYGMYMNEEKFDALLNEQTIADRMKEDDVVSDIRRLSETFGETNARRMVALRVCIEDLRTSHARLANGENVDVMKLLKWDSKFFEAFTGYTGSSCADYSQGCRFDDLFLPNGKFDYAAVECGQMARTGLDGKKHLYLGGSFFAAHRSPSGNIEAFSGLARAVAPITFDEKGNPGQESKYALDPVTTNNQGSDTDGDSAGLQFADYTIPGVMELGITPERIREFTKFVTQAAAPVKGDNDKYARPDSAAISRAVMAFEPKWTVVNEYGETVIKPEVFRVLNRMLFEAQIENYRTSPTRHQGYADFTIRTSGTGRAADIVTGAELSDSLGGLGTVIDSGFTGRSPVGTDAVFAEPVTRAGYERLMAAVGNQKIADAVEFEEGLTYTQILNKAVDAFEKGKTDLYRPLSASRMADAASDSADARGISVFLQSRFLRALAHAVAGKTGSEVISAVRADGYSPVIDLISHFDGISNNLFDTLKKMFATRAGWTKELLPVMLARVVRSATDRLIDDSSARLDNEFFATELVKFLVEYNDKSSAVNRFRRYSDAVGGRDALLEDIKELRDSVRETDKVRYQMIGEALTHVTPSMSASEIADLVLGRASVTKYERNEVLFYMAAHIGKVVAGRAVSARDLLFYQDTTQSALDMAKTYGDLSDFPKVSKYTYANIAKKHPSLSTEATVSGANEAVSRQSTVSWMFMDWMKNFGESRETAISGILSNLRRAHNTEIDSESYTIRPVQEVSGNYDRLVHLYGAMSELSDRVGSRENLEALLSIAGKTTEEFLRNVAAAVREETGKVLKSGEIGPIADLFRSLVVNDITIDLRATSSAAKIETLRAGFDALAQSNRIVTLNGKKIKGSTLAALIMVHECSLRPFSATTSYVSQSNLPAVFGEERIARMERGRRIVEDFADARELVNCPAAKIKSYREMTAYDVKTWAGRMYDLSRRVNPASVVRKDTFIEELVDWSNRPKASVDSLGMRSDNLEEEGLVPFVDPRIAPVFTVAHRFSNMPDAFRAVDADGKFTDAAYGSLEEALNASAFAMSDKIVSSAEETAKLVYLLGDGNGRDAYLTTAFGGRDSWMTKTAKRILADAAVRNAHVYDAIASVQSGTELTAANASVATAYNYVRRRMDRDPDFRPNAAAEVNAGEGAGKTVRIDATSVLRSSYLRSLEALYPGFDKTARENAARAVPAAIEASFSKVFGKGNVKVTVVKNEAGEDTNVVRIERKANGKTIVTHVAFGETIRRNRIDPNDKLYVRSVVNAINAARGEAGPKLNAEDILSLPEQERALYMSVLNEKARSNGESWGKENLGLEFAGAMSGLIRLDTNAGYRTLFHEYFHQMLSCYRNMGICSEEDLSKLAQTFPTEDRKFDEEKAADAYATYITRIGRGERSEALRDFDATKDTFERFRTAAEMLAEATVRGTGPDGLPVFVRCTLLDGLTTEELAKVKDPDPVAVKALEATILGGTVGNQTAGSLIPNLVSVEQEVAISQAYKDLKEGKVPVKDVLRRLSNVLAKPVPAPEPTAIDPAPAPAPRPPVVPEMSPVGKVSAFLGAAVNTFSKRQGRYEELASDLRELADCDVMADLSTKPLAIRHAVMNVRRLIREVALSFGLEVEAVKDGKTVLTETGKALFASSTVNELALRLMSVADFERKGEKTGYVGEASNAGADYAFARILERMSPGSYRAFALKQAARSRSLFIAAQQAALAAAEEHARRGDNAGADRFRRQAEQLAGRAVIVIDVVDKISSGADLHMYFPRNKNEGNLHGLMFKRFTGGAVKAEIQGADGIQRYKTDGKFAFDFSLEDPLVQSAFDAANMAFYTSEAARGFAGKHARNAKGEYDPFEGTGVTEEILNPTAEQVAGMRGALEQSLSETPAKTPEPAPEPFDTVEFDLGTNSPEWILSNPGSWLSSDMQKDFGAVGLREMMTDHSMQAATENAYALATTALQVFGCDCYAGDKLRYMELAQSELGRNERGDFAYVKDGKHFIRFAHTTGYFFGAINFGAKRVGRGATCEELQMTNFTLQGIASAAAGDSHVITGIDLGYIANKADLAHIGTKGWYTPKAVRDRVLGVDKNNKASSLDKVLFRIALDLPQDVAGKTVLGPRDLKTGDCEWKATDPTDGLYAKVLDTLASAKAEIDRQRTDADRQKIIVRALEKAGYVRTGNGGRRTTVAVPVADIRKAWDSSSAKSFLNEGGRPMELLSFDYWSGEFARASTKLNRTAAKSSYIRNGVGSTITAAGSPSFWFHSGSGAHMLDVQKYQTVSQALASMQPSDEAKLRETYGALFETLALTGAKDLKTKAFSATGGTSLTNTQVIYLAELMGLNTNKDSGFTVDNFLERVARGDFADGREVPGIDIGPDSTKADVVIAINRLVTDKVVEGLSGGTVNGATAQQLVDLNAVNDRLTKALNDQVPGRILAMSDQQMFERSGQTGTSWTAPERIMNMCQELVAAERFRSCLSQMLTSVSFDGTVNYVVDPSEFAADVNRMPDEYWGALARFVIARSGWCKNLPAYDESKTGVENMQDVYRAIKDGDSEKRYDHMDGDKEGAYPLMRGILCRKSDADTCGNVNELTRKWGGEAKCYMKQLLGSIKAPDTGTGLKQVERVMAWTKLASVGFSSFFQIATAFESQTAAAGFTQAFMGNLPGKSGAKLGRAIGRALGRSGGLGAFQADALSFKDIVDNINSNDPFIVELREMCDLIGMPLDQNIDYAIAHNESNPGLGQGGIVKQDIETIYRWAQKFNVKGAGQLKSFLNFAYQHPTDYTFNVVLNGVKMAVVAQAMRRLREECAAGNRPFDPVKELRKHAAYMNAEIGGIDPGRYAWAHPQMQRILRLGMFSWQWTVGAWVAGSGEAISDMLFGGHSTTRASRQYAFIRWMRMLGIVKFGVPLVLQAAVKVLAKAMASVVPPPDDPEEEEDEKNVPWLMWNNESKAGSLSFDITPLLKLAARIPGVRALKEAEVPLVSALIPAYVGGGRNTTGKRRYYMHFGKQSDEFFRWFTDPVSQMVSKTSIPGQKVLEGLFGKVSPNGYSKPFAELDFFERWFNTNFTADNNAWVNLGQMFLPFSWQGAKANADAGLLAAVGPMRMGQSKRSTRLRIVERMNQMIEDSRSNDPWAYSRNRRKLNLLCTDILREAQLNGVDPHEIMTSALGDVAHVQYLKLMDSLPKDANSPSVDSRQAMEAIRALTLVNRKARDIRNSVVQKYTAAGTDAKKNPFFYKALKDLIRTTQQTPFADDEQMGERFNAWFGTTDDLSLRSTQLADKAGENIGNFLATDKVPETLFGVPVVTAGYTKDDVMFFKEHPEAGGFYEIGGEA